MCHGTGYVVEDVLVIKHQEGQKVAVTAVTAVLQGPGETHVIVET
jgi:hypothetical protein